MRQCDVKGQIDLLCCMSQVDGFLPSYLADMVSAYANMVHHPGPLIDQMTQRMLPSLHVMEAGTAQFLSGNALPFCMFVLASKLPFQKQTRAIIPESSVKRLDRA